MFLSDDTIITLFCMKADFYLHDFSSLHYDKSLALTKKPLHDKTVSTAIAEEIVRYSS